MNLQNVRYPSVWEFSDIRSPVVRVNSSAVHSNFSVIWRKIEIAFAQEIWQWGNTFDKILDHTLFKLSALSRKQEYITTKSHAVWRIHRYNLKTLVKILRFLYFRQYGNPVWATTEEDVIQFLNTIDTCCSREVREDAEDDYGVKEDAQVERSVEVSMKFGADDAQVRRYMRQIVIDPSHIYATAGEEFGIKLTIWDPHQTFEQLKGTTTFALDPEIPWLKYNAKTHTFSGQVPEDLGDHITSESGRLTHYKLELGFIAKITDTLPKGPERETTIRAKVNIWVQNDGQSANSLFNDLQQLSDIPVFFTTSPTPCVSDNGEAAATARCGEETEYEEQPSFSFVRMNDSYGNMDNTSFEHMDHTLGAPSSPYEAFVAAMLPKFWEGTPAPEHHFFPYEDSFSSVAPGEVYEETGLDSWMQNAMIARELSRSWGQAVRQETTPSDLAQRNEFWDLSTLSPEERSRHALRSFSYQNPSDELDGYEAEENQIVSYDSVDEACLCLDGLVDNKPFLDGYFGKLEDKGDEGCTRSEASVLATEGCLSPQNSDYDDYYEECEMMQTLGRGGPRL